MKKIRKIAANLIFPITSPPIKNGVLVFENQTLIDIVDRGGKLIETDRCEFYNGVLIPGLINAHCHLELSHLQGKIPQGAGMKPFLRNVMTQKTDFAAQIHAAQRNDRLMQSEGIVAVGDVSNTSVTLDVKTVSPIFYHTFVEIVGLEASEIADRYNKMIAILESFLNQGLSASLTPHAAYSVHRNLLEKIASSEQGAPLSIHTLENPVECEQITKDHDSFLRFFQEMGINPDFENHCHPYLYLLAPFMNRKVLIVHNIASTQTDWDIARRIAQKQKLELFPVTCPRSNRYIHGEIPDYSTWPQDLPICIGTDSLASNTDLSVFRELLFLTQNTNLLFSTIIGWATINGAKALGLDHRFGSFEVEKTPGVNLISGFDFQQQKLLPHSILRRIL